MMDDMRYSKSWRVVLALMKLEAEDEFDRSSVIIMMMAAAQRALLRRHGKYPFEGRMFVLTDLVMG
jgi:hypothetical protein